MVRGKIWFRCAVVHDPVCPRVVSPAVVGWEAKNRKVDLVIERAFKGDELVARMKGWITVDPLKVIEIVNRYGRLKVLDDSILFVEPESDESFLQLQEALKENFGGEVDLEPVKKS
jgi:hypothetical protein